MKFWQSLAFVEMEQLVDVARLAEDLGFHGVSYADHLVTTKAQADRYRYSQDGEIVWDATTPWPDPWVLTGSLAQVTTTLRFMTTVYVLPLRDPFTAAKAVATAAVLSQHRVALGIGVGWQKAEFDLVGQDFHRRGQRADEQLEVMRKLMSGTMVEHHGAYYDFGPLQMSPGTAAPVPVYIGGQSEAAFQRAARHDGWLGLQYVAADLPPILERLAAARRAAGTEHRPFEVWVALRDLTPDAVKRAEDGGVTMLNGASFMAGGKARRSSFEEKRRMMEEFAERFIG
jgi:probable F420-dependent oxidoreductase